jgi:hypothetical protein
MSNNLDDKGNPNKASINRAISNYQKNISEVLRSVKKKHKDNPETTIIIDEIIGEFLKIKLPVLE